MNLHKIPQYKTKYSFLYVEHALIEKTKNGIIAHDKNGDTNIPIANLTTLMIGPGVSISCAAIQQAAEKNCLIIWCGEEGVRYYAHGLGGTYNAKNILYQANLVCDEEKHLEVASTYVSKTFWR